MQLTPQRKESLAADAKQAAAELESGRPAEALRTLQHLVARADESPEIARFHASLAMAMARWDEALSLLEDLARVLPDGQTFINDRAMCLIGLDRLDEAESLLASTDAAEADAPARLVIRARIAARRGDRTRAADLLKLACGSDSALLDEVLKRPLCAAILCSTGADDQSSGSPVYN